MCLYVHVCVCVCVCLCVEFENRSKRNIPYTLSVFVYAIIVLARIYARTRLQASGCVSHERGLVRFDSVSSKDL